MVYSKETTATQVAGDLSQEIQGKVILVTGVSPGSLGAAFAETVAKHSPSLLVLAGRNTSKTQQTADTVNVNARVLELDLGSFKSARNAAKTVNSWEDVPHIDVVVNSAGIMAVPFELTADGVERQFATNHLGHFLFTNLIMGKVLKAGKPRVVNVSSNGHRFSPIRWDYNFQEGKVYNPWRAYGQSKTANVLFSVALAEKLGSKGLVATSLHPGVIYTNLGGHVDWAGEGGASLHEVDVSMGNKASLGGAGGWEFKTLDQGAATHVYASFSPDVTNGGYYCDSQLANPYDGEIMPWATNKIEADRLWKLSEKLVGQEFKL